MGRPSVGRPNPRLRPPPSLARRLYGRNFSAASVRGEAADTPGGDRAAMRLTELFEHFGRLDQIDQFGAVLRVASGEAYPPTPAALRELRWAPTVVAPTS